MYKMSWTLWDRCCNECTFDYFLDQTIELAPYHVLQSPNYLWLKNNAKHSKPHFVLVEK